MVKTVLSKVLQVGRITALALGVAVMLALVVGMASAALAGTGIGATFNLGKVNSVNKISALVGSTKSPMLGVANKGNGTALNLRVKSGKPPMTVNSGRKVKNLNADKLDGQDSSAFVQTNTNAFVRNDIYKTESAIGPGTQIGDGTFVANEACDPGDILLSGGPANINATSTLLESFPTPGTTNSWSVRINKNGQADNFNVVVLCANQ
ncbi:MAG: hypothetical protein K6T51_14730 [Rubrobacteraceae bacterium]|uniref:hypothetical protein n=1 Tax=Rubrobacter naiadicus TaxID=1392641 RepID=UPI002362F2BC|nr:hypothetical protein [Rubrobacter naiadicus]MBX6765346.1 hypothetical protein [Rubrobacteraceae bacterium]MCL6439855.1 hypothetical protein [Rubrobacteraceae bacterium]